MSNLSKSMFINEAAYQEALAEERAKHTPGPWVASKFGFQVLTGDSWNSICELKGSAEWEDGRGTYEPQYEGQNREANARLIAAAPDLLEALKTFADHAQDRRADDPTWRDGDTVKIVVTIGDLRRASAAVSKAEGR
ncbi:hypothetical protein [Nitratireductor sp. CH_MIT9313-5]|uniref:hypothetical protein n=1 Tax=Nitratireductor sp. CH_MIT9313-5 TaxID=3107764 RepID=UPI003007F926